jgi:CheY-like chemotaxis protein
VTQIATMPKGAPIPRRILVVDDNPDITGSLCAMLEAIGLVCHEAYDGQSALVGVDEFAPHVMLLDLAMPLMNGFEVIERLRQRPGRDAMTIVAITGHGALGDTEQVRQAGFDDCLLKPIGFDAIRALLDRTGEVPAAPAEPAGPPPSLVRLMTAADEACAGGDAAALASAMLPMVSVAPESLAIDLVAVLELCRYDMELAALRWSNLRGFLRVQAAPPGRSPSTP